MLVMALSLAPPGSQAQAPMTEVLALRDGSSVRLMALDEVCALRLEILSRHGDKLFDSQIVAGSELQWPLFDAAGAPLPDGTYYYTLTLTYQSGSLVRQLGQVVLRWNRALLRPQFLEHVDPTGEVQRQQALENNLNVSDVNSGGLFQLDLSGGGDGKPILTFLNPLPAPAFTSDGGRALVARGCCDGQGGGALVAQFGNGAVLDETRQALLAHDGTDGRLVIRGGALRLSTGNLFDGSDVERLRVTPSGDVGIGVSTPTAKLEVAGEIKGMMITTPVLNATSQYNLGGARILSNEGTSNLFAGVGAGAVNTTGGGNAFFGASAGRFNTEGSSNAFFGVLAGGNNTTGHSNAFVGQAAGLHNTTGLQNAFFGTDAGLNNTAGNFNAFFGTSAGYRNTTGAFNTIIGREANVAVGDLSNATALGARAVVACSNCLVLGGTGANAVNVGIGVSSPTARLEVNGEIKGTMVTTPVLNATTQYNLGGARILSNAGTNNLFVGVGAGAANTTGSGNAFFGRDAGLSNTTGESNAFFGRLSGWKNTTGNNNAFFGGAGAFNTTGSFNAFFGNVAGNTNTTGSQNAFFGMAAGAGNSGTGVGNAVFGAFAGTNFFTGNYNTIIGYQADVPDGASDLTNATALGAFARVGCSNCMVLGATGINAVNVGIGLTTPTFRLHLAENSAAKPGSASWTVASDRRLKQDIRPYTDGLAKLLQLNPVWYRYNGQAGLPTDKDYVGVIAQEAQAVAPYTVSAYRAKLHPQDAEETELLHFDSGALTFMTINAVRELHATVEGLRGTDAGEMARLRAENAAQRQQLAEQRQRLSDLEQRLAALEQRVSKLTRE
jgi:hypothetical protein